MTFTEEQKRNLYLIGKMFWESKCNSVVYVKSFCRKNNINSDLLPKGLKIVSYLNFKSQVWLGSEGFKTAITVYDPANPETTILHITQLPVKDLEKMPLKVNHQVFGKIKISKKDRKLAEKLIEELEENKIK
jgi:hypothetical protein